MRRGNSPASFVPCVNLLARRGVCVLVKGIYRSPCATAQRMTLREPAVDNDVSAGSGTTTVAGRLALGITLLAFGLGTTGVINDVTTSDAVSVAHYVGGVALFLVGLLAFRDRDTAN